MSIPSLELGVRVSAFAFEIDISILKIILDVEYFIKSMIHQMLKFLKRIAYFMTR